MNPFSLHHVKPGFNRFSAARKDSDSQGEDNNSDNGSADGQPISGDKTPQSTNGMSESLIRGDTIKNEVKEEKKELEKSVENIKPKVQKFEGVANDENDELFKGKIKESWIKIAYSSPQITDDQVISMRDWENLQEVLKDNLYLAQTEFDTKESLVKKLSNLNADYATLQFAIREKNELISQKKFKDGNTKALVRSTEIFEGDTEKNIKSFLSILYHNPKVLAFLSKNRENVKGLEETLVLACFKDYLADEDGDFEVLRLFSEMLQFELNNIQKTPEQAKQEGLNRIWSVNMEGFFNKLWTAYLKKTECKTYLKTVLRLPLLVFLREKPKMKFDPNEVKKDLEKRRSKQQKAEKKLEEANLKSPSKEEANKQDFKPLDNSPTLVVNKEEIDRVPPPKYKPRFRTTATPSAKANDEAKDEAKEEKGFEMVDDERESPLAKIDDKEVVASIMRKFRSLKRHLTTLIQSIFDSLEFMPKGLRLICSMIYTYTKKKFPDFEDKEIYKVLFNYLFTKWIVPPYCVPGKTEVLEDFENTEDIFNSLTFIAKVLKEIFHGGTYQAEDILSEMNDFMKEIMPSVQQYFKELVTINENSLEEILQNKNRAGSQLKSRAMCISLQEIQLLYKSILKHKEELPGSFERLVTLAETLSNYDQNDGIFTPPVPEKDMKDSKASMAQDPPPTTYVLFSEILLPEQFDIEYPEEFSKALAVPKTASEDEKNVLRSKIGLKTLLMNIKDIRSVFKWTLDDTSLNLEDALTLYSNKPIQIDSKWKKNDQSKFQLSAKFLAALLKKLPEEYRQNNFFKLYKEMQEDLTTQTKTLHSLISSAKFQLLDSLEMMKSKMRGLNDILEERLQTQKKIRIRNCIKHIRFYLCTSSPATIEKHMMTSVNRTDPKKSNLGFNTDKVEFRLKEDQGCIHEKLSMISELTIAGDTVARGNSRTKGSMTESRSGSNNNAAKVAFEDNKPSHAQNVDKFVPYFGSLPEVKQMILKGKDEFGANECIVNFYNYVFEELCAQNPDMKELIREDEMSEKEDKLSLLIEDEIENYVCRQLYYIVVPLQEQEFDRKFYKICKLHDWVTFDHLEIPLMNQQTEMWEYAAKMLNQMDLEITPIDKLDCLVECFKIITQVLDLAAGKGGSGGADETLPIMIYIVLKACPRRILVNSNFIENLRNRNKMQAERGFCFISLQSAVMSIQNIDHTFLRMEKDEYDQMIQKKEMELRLLGKIK